MVLVLYVLAEIATMIWLPTSSQATAGTVFIVKHSYRGVYLGGAQLHDRSTIAAVRGPHRTLLL